MSLSTTADLKRLAAPVYFPWGLSSLGIGMLIPVLPLYLRDQGLSFTLLAVVLAASGVGAAVSGLPTAVLLARVGERRLIAVGVTAMAVTTALLGVTNAVVALAAFRLIFGGGSIATRLALQSAITRSVPPTRRGRAMSLMGGTVRLAFLIGPLLGGALLDLFGFRTVFVVTGVVMICGLVLQALQPAADQNDVVSSAPDPVSVRSALVRHRALLLRAGLGPALVMTVRTGRQVVVPLIGNELGLSATAVGALVAIGATADLLLFPIAGYVMDRFGRLWAMVPSFSLLAVGLGLLSVAGSTAAVVVAGVVMGIGNGLSSGTLLTFSSDLAPTDSPGPFLAAMATMQDTGKVLGPLLVGLFADAAGLGTAAGALGATMVVAIAWIVLAVGETRGLVAAPGPHPRKRSRSQH